MVDLAEFSSDAFSPFLPDECQVNPQVYGAELAFWLSRALAGNGIVTSYPEYEDWGWYIEYLTESESEFAVHCGNVGESSSRWLLSLRRYGRKIFGRDKPPYSEASDLVTSIKRCLETSESVADMVWMYAELKG